MGFSEINLLLKCIACLHPLDAPSPPSHGPQTPLHSLSFLYLSLQNEAESSVNSAIDTTPMTSSNLCLLLFFLFSATFSLSFEPLNTEGNKEFMFTSFSLLFSFSRVHSIIHFMVVLMVFQWRPWCPLRALSMTLMEF